MIQPRHGDRPARIVISNVVALNGGDAAILFGIMRILQRVFDDPDFTVVDDQAVVTSRLYPALTVLQRASARWTKNRFGRKLADGTQYMLRGLIARSASYRTNARIYADADLIVSTGGTYLVEHYRLSERFAQLWLAIRSGKPLILFTQSLGPFARPSNRQWIRAIAQNARLILLRDERSRDHLRQVGASVDRALVVPDAAFALADAEHLRGIRAGAVRDCPKVAISVREWKHFRGAMQGTFESETAYRDSIAAAITSLVRERAAEIVMISTCQGVAEYAKDDSRVAQQIFDALPGDVRDKVKVDAAFHSPIELLELLKNFDAVIATRMHMAILSMCAGVPVLGIAYEFKTRELFEKMGLADWTLDIEDCNSTDLAKRALRLVDVAHELRADVARAALREAREIELIETRLRSLCVPSA